MPQFSRGGLQNLYAPVRSRPAPPIFLPRHLELSVSGFTSILSGSKNSRVNCPGRPNGVALFALPKLFASAHEAANLQQTVHATPTFVAKMCVCIQKVDILPY